MIEALLFAVPMLVIVTGFKLLAAGHRLLGRLVLLAGACGLALVVTQGAFLLDVLLF